ncbi:MAG: pentapeptide repeat-containing protein [Fibrobacteria bacterium]
MKTEIQQVLKMNKEGAITDEQAAELLAELARNEAVEGKPAEDRETGKFPRDARNLDHIDIMDSIFSRVNDTVKVAMDGAFSWDRQNGAGGSGGTGAFRGAAGYRGEAYGSDTSRNHIHMSKFDVPHGKDHVFTGNSVRMSSLKDMRLDRAEMIDNSIDMSKVHNLSVRDGKVIGCGVRASAVEDWSVDGATVRAVEISGSKITDFHCGSGSVVRGARVQGASLKDFRIVENSKAADLVVNATALSDVSVSRTSLSQSEIHASHIAGLSLQDCDARNLMLRMLSLKHSAFSGCALIDVVFSGAEKWTWKKQGIRDTRFENCRLEKVLFADCRFTDVTLRNLTLKDLQFRHLELSGQVLDGDDAFLRAIGEKS